MPHLSDETEMDRARVSLGVYSSPQAREVDPRFQTMVRSVEETASELMIETSAASSLLQGIYDGYARAWPMTPEITSREAFIVRS